MWRWLYWWVCPDSEEVSNALAFLGTSEVWLPFSYTVRPITGAITYVPFSTSCDPTAAGELWAVGQPAEDVACGVVDGTDGGAWYSKACAEVSRCGCQVPFTTSAPTPVPTRTMVRQVGKERKACKRAVACPSFPFRSVAFPSDGMRCVSVPQHHIVECPATLPTIFCFYGEAVLFN